MRLFQRYAKLLSLFDDEKRPKSHEVWREQSWWAVVVLTELR